MNRCRLCLFLFLLFPAAFLYAQPRNGVSRTYYSNGQPQDEGSYKKKLKQGVWMHYDESGKLESKTTWNAGKKEGPSFHYDNGTLIFAQWYHNDSLHGVQYEYSRSGALQYITDFRNGKKNGWRRAYAAPPRGYILYKEYFRNDTLMTRYTYHYNGSIKMIEPVLNGEVNGTVRMYPYREAYNRDTFPTEITEFRNDKREGIRKTLYTNGQAQSEDLYHDGVLEGTSKSYDPEGRITAIRTYKAGKLNGPSTVYRHRDAEFFRMEVTIFENNLREGKSCVLMGSDTVEVSWHSKGMNDSLIEYSYEAGKRYISHRIRVVHTGDQSHYEDIKYYPDGKIMEEGQRDPYSSRGWGYYWGRRVTYFPNGKKQTETWYRDHDPKWQYNSPYESVSPDSIYRTWYESGKPEISCRIRQGTLMAKPDLWNEAGVKLAPSSPEYAKKFRSAVMDAIYVDPDVYDPSDDKIAWRDTGNDYPEERIGEATQEAWVEELARDPGAMIPENPDTLPRFPGSADAMTDLILYSVSPSEYWFSDLPEDSIVISYFVWNNGNISDVRILHCPAGQKKLGVMVKNIFSSNRRLIPGRKEGRDVNSRGTYTLHLRELKKLASGNTQ